MVSGRVEKIIIMNDSTLYNRVLLKLIGEALMGGLDHGIDPAMIGRVAAEVKQVAEMGVQVGLVIGGGNIFRGAGLASNGMDRTAGDHMGMLATVMNSLAMQDALQRIGQPCTVMSALSMSRVCDDYTQRGAIENLEAGRVVVFAAGTGNPYFTTDTAGCLRAVEIHADAILKATKVDGVYDSDPVTNPEAIRFDTLTYDEVLERDLRVMDATAIVLCRDNQLPLRVFNLNQEGALPAAMRDTSIGSTVTME